MTPACAIEQLERHLANHGQDVRLRPGSTAAGEITARAFVRGFKPEELIGGLTQQHSKVVMSPVEIIATGWSSGAAAPLDSRVPRSGNYVVIAGKPRQIVAGTGIYMAGVLVRIELSVLG